MNKVNPKALLHSKWTKTQVTNKEKHFVITQVTFDEDQSVVGCIIEAVISRKEYDIQWRDLKDNAQWKLGWK